MSDRVFVVMIAIGVMLIIAGVYFSNKAPATRRESCGCTGFMIVVGSILVLIPPVSVLIALALYRSGLL